MGIKGPAETTPHRDIRAFLEDGCELEGKLHFTGVVRLNGCLKGDINTEDILIIGQTADIEGSINVGATVIGGRVVGNVKARQKVEVLPTGAVDGTITAPLLVTHEGARILGQVTVGTAGTEPSRDPVSAPAKPAK